MAAEATGSDFDRASLHTLKVLDVDDLTSRCMGKTELVDRILSSLCPSLAGDIQQLDEAFTNQDIESVTTLAHRVKGTAANVAAKRFEAVAARLEDAARAEQPWEELRALYELLTEERQQLVEALDRRTE